MTTPHCARAHLGLLTVATALLSACACAQPKGNDRPPTPPAEALAACNTAAAGAPCNFSSPPGTVNGNCWAPVGNPLACKPTHPPAAAPARQGAVTKP